MCSSDEKQWQISFCARINTSVAHPATSAEVSSLEKQLEGKNKQLDSEKKRYDDLLRERDILTKLKSQAENSSTKQLDLIKINEGTKRNLEQEVQVCALVRSVFKDLRCHAACTIMHCSIHLS